MNIRKEIKDAILAGRLYDFVVNNQHRLSKDELVELVKNLDFTAYQNQCTSYPIFCENLIENLNDYDFFEDN